MLTAARERPALSPAGRTPEGRTPEDRTPCAGVAHVYERPESSGGSFRQPGWCWAEPSHYGGEAQAKCRQGRDGEVVRTWEAGVHARRD